MNKKKVIMSLVSTVSLVSIMFSTLALAKTQSASPKTSNAITKVIGPTFNSEDALKKWANENQINVIVKDSSGKPIKEFHTDGKDISIIYGSSNIITVADQHGHSRSMHLRQNSTFSNATTNTISPMTTTENGSSYYVDGYNMNNLISDYNYTTNYNNITQSSMQAEFDNLNSVLRNNVEEYTEQSDGTYVDDGWSSNPAALIMADANEYGINPLVILTTLQKEQGLVFSSSASVSSLAWAMGYGATDNGTYYLDSGFANQISLGTQALHNFYTSAPLSYPQSRTVNNGQWQYWGNYAYGPTVDVQNAATYALYTYTPWTCELGSNGPYGGNLSFAQIYPEIEADF